ncbi:hypothetical protein [Sphingomonas echinoides]|uniref:Uncharacterized protein n=1 Tax=Sphingomonas echinoides TaxID=59803 RepID=A0ABU4PR26_9SPHN|nr:hypothetical protein [Sphingomonas echinoides]MDX5985612.1 hypothetical protein [Sphingomonas echinoides]
MTRPMCPALLLLSAIAASAACLPTAGFAQQATTAPTTPAPATTQPSSGDTIRLSDRERDAILNSNTVESAAAARGERPGSGGPGIHGEIGAMIGSNGTRGVYGTAAIPLGDNAGAVVSFESSHYNWPRRSR